METLNALKDAGTRLARAKRNLAEATEAAKSVANAAYEQKVYEITIAELLGVDRMTVRRWLGKRRVQDGKF